MSANESDGRPSRAALKVAADKGKGTGDSIKEALEEMDAFDTGGVSARRTAAA